MDKKTRGSRRAVRVDDSPMIIRGKPPVHAKPFDCKSAAILLHRAHERIDELLPLMQSKAQELALVRLERNIEQLQDSVRAAEKWEAEKARRAQSGYEELLQALDNLGPVTGRDATTRAKWARTILQTVEQDSQSDTPNLDAQLAKLEIVRRGLPKIRAGKANSRNALLPRINASIRKKVKAEHAAFVKRHGRAHGAISHLSRKLKIARPTIRKILGN